MRRILAATTALAIIGLTSCSSGSSTSPTATTLASDAQIALGGIEVAESLYFMETGASATLQAQVTQANNAAQAAITSLANSGATIGTVQQDIDAAFSALQAVNTAYGTLSTADAKRAAQFAAYLKLAQTTVQTVEQFVAPASLKSH